MLQILQTIVNLLRQQKENRSDGFLLWTFLKCRTSPSTNQIVWKDGELELYGNNTYIYFIIKKMCIVFSF